MQWFFILLTLYTTKITKATKASDIMISNFVFPSTSLRACFVSFVVSIPLAL